jgi:hypothetical protein
MSRLGRDQQRVAAQARHASLIGTGWAGAAIGGKWRRRWTCDGKRTQSVSVFVSNGLVGSVCRAENGG